MEQISLPSVLKLQELAEFLVPIEMASTPIEILRWPIWLSSFPADA